jgi:HSP20 family protein
MNDLTLFDSLFDAFPGYAYRRPLALPRADVTEDKKGYTLILDLPGRSEQDVSIELDRNVLTVSSKVEETKPETDTDTTWLIKERSLSSFSRSFTLPDEVQTDQISASFKNGILTITIPHSEKKAPRRIAIEAA